jgi:hypothetical protein
LRKAHASLLSIFREPVLPEARRGLRASFLSLPPRFRKPEQMFGRQGNPCGATLGAMPRCDFACRGCYLGEGANRVPALPIGAVKAQMRQLRPLLGHNGNLQLTDGEITLRKETELVELLRYAHALGLLPMLMTHGESFRRRPGLLERLMVAGGLREIGIHVDTTMRGRQGPSFAHATREEELNPLREEFAAIIRSARRTTGRPLAAATTMTVTPENLIGVPEVMRCVARNADAYKMISFQPVAQVGRTEAGLGGGVAPEALWEAIARGLSGPARDPTLLGRGQMWFGHPACNRTVHGFVLDEPGRTPGFFPLRLQGDPIDEGAIERYLARFGGASFRSDTKAEAAIRLLGMVVRAPAFWVADVLPYLWHQVLRVAPENTLGFIAKLFRGRARLHHFQIVSHHFMDKAEIETAGGRERLDLCVFRVPVGKSLVAMCEVNALGLRDRYYEDIRAGRLPGTRGPFVPLGRGPAFSSPCEEAPKGNEAGR